MPASRPALTYSPLTHTDTTSSSSSRRCFQVSYSWCHWALSRCNEAAESGAPSPNRSRSASSNSPSARPCRDNRGSSSPTGLVRRVNHGRSRLTNRLLTPRTRGYHAVIVPQLRVSWRGLPSPLRYPSSASTAARRADFARPSRIVTSSTHSCWTNCWMWPRTKSYRCLDSTPVPLRCSFTAVSPFLARIPRRGFATRKVAIACSYFHTFCLYLQLILELGTGQGRWLARSF